MNDRVNEPGANDNSSDHEVIYRWEPNEWTTQPGTNCPPLSPAVSGIVKTLPPSEVSVFEQNLPPIPDEIKNFNESYLEAIGGLKNNKWIAIIPGIVGFPLMIVGLAVFLVYIIAERESLNASILIIPGLIAAVMIPVLLLMAYTVFSIAVFSPEDEPTRFSRRDKKIYRYQARRWRWLGMDMYFPGNKAEIKSYDWANCRAEVLRKVHATSSTAGVDCFLQLAILDPSTQQVVERFRVGDRDVYSDFTGRIFLWETIRRYMQDGTANIAPPSPYHHRETLADCIEDFNPFSVPAKSVPGAQRVFGYFFAVLLWVPSLMLVLAVLSRWVAFKISSKISWGELEHSVFAICPDDPALQRSLRPEIATPNLWEIEIKRRRKAAWLWFASIAFQLILLWWHFSKPSYY